MVVAILAGCAGHRDASPVPAPSQGLHPGTLSTPTMRSPETERNDSRSTGIELPSVPGTGGLTIPPDGRGATPTEALYPRETQGTWIWPTASRVISDPFGLPRSRGYHTGIDIVDRWKAPVYAAAPGLVIWADDEGPTYGLSVIIRHSNGWLSRYAHLSGIYPQVNAG